MSFCISLQIVESLKSESMTRCLRSRGLHKKNQPTADQHLGEHDCFGRLTSRSLKKGSANAEINQSLSTSTQLRSQLGFTNRDPESRPNSTLNISHCPSYHPGDEGISNQAKAKASKDRRNIITYPSSSRLDKSRAHQRIHVSPLHLRSILIILHFLQKYSQNFHRRLQAQHIGTLPALQSGDTDARLQHQKLANQSFTEIQDLRIQNQLTPYSPLTSHSRNTFSLTLKSS